MSARLMCQLAYYAKHDGAVGPVSDFAMRPNASTGHYQRKIDTALGSVPRLTGTYFVPAPCYTKHNLRRVVRQTPVRVPHEVLDSELKARPLLRAELQASVDQRVWPEQYWRHPLVSAAARPVMPLALYVDGVAFLKKDSVLGIWVYSLLTEKRHLVCVLRKRWMCRCGCRGWCSLYPCLELVRWSLLWASRGEYPPTGHDGRQRALDEPRAALSGDELHFKGVLLHIKGDWAEFAHTLGFPTWSSNRNPCCFCHTDRLGMYSLHGASLLALPHPEITQVDYITACSRCQPRPSVVVEV